jgi:hypothetical protein
MKTTYIIVNNIFLVTFMIPSLQFPGVMYVGDASEGGEAGDMSLAIEMSKYY